MTEEDLTKLAILKSEADKIKHQTEAVSKFTTDTAGTPVNKDNSKLDEAAPQIDQPAEVINPSDFPNKLILGENKEVMFKPWNGKTRKIFKKMASEIDDVDITAEDFEKLQEILFRDYISVPDMYLSAVEQQYLLIKIREYSLNGDFSYVSACPECDEYNDISTTIHESCVYTPSKYPTKDEGFGIEYVDIISQTFFKSEIERVLKSPNWDGLTSEGDVEIAMHIKLNDAQLCDDVLDEMDEMSLSKLNLITTQLASIASDLKIGVTKKCSHCNEEVYFETDEGPDVFEDLL